MGGKANEKDVRMFGGFARKEKFRNKEWPVDSTVAGTSVVNSSPLIMTETSKRCFLNVLH